METRQNHRNHPCQVDAIENSVGQLILEENEMLAGIYRLLEYWLRDLFVSSLHDKSERD